MINTTSKPAWTKNMITLVEKNLARNLILSQDHLQVVDCIRTTFAKQTVQTKEKELQQRTIDAESRVVQYARDSIKNTITILALIAHICDNWNLDEQFTLTFIHAQRLVALLITKNSYSREALLIYQAALFEKSNPEEASSCLSALPTVSKEEKDNYHVLSSFFKSPQDMSNNTEFLLTLQAIGPDSLLSYQVPTAVAISPMRTNPEQQITNIGCTCAIL